MGGEKFARYNVIRGFWGSPPRGRGKVPFATSAMFSLGITPAWAGKRTALFSVHGSGRDHPRVGGEKRSRSNPIHAMPGSPPRGRGKEDSRNACPSGSGITPAWAGKSGSSGTWGRSGQDHPRVGGEKASRTLTARRMSDHPRVGGEKCPMCQWRRSLKGSPPRGRGKVTLECILPTLPGITPAWAGKRVMFHRPFLCLRDHPRVGGEKYVPLR